MKNVSFERKGDKLIVTIDTSKTFGPSSSGKTLLVGTTEGNVDVPGLENGKIGINVYVPNPEYAAKPAQGQKKA